MQKKVYSISLKNADGLPGLMQRPQEKDTNVVGITLNENEIDSVLYNTVSKVNTPCLFILEKSVDTLQKEVTAQNTSTAQDLVPLLMHHSQFQYFLNKPLFVNVKDCDLSLFQKWSDLLRQKFCQLGLKNVSLYCNTKSFGDASELFQEIIAEKPANGESIAWRVFPVNDSRQIDALINDPTFRSEDVDEITRLKEENTRLRLHKSTLLKNIDDLNKYYRLVRGETSFKFH